MIQPARVLPSNAPPLQDAESVHHASRVLQEHPGNRQQNDYSYLNGLEQKYQAGLMNENNYLGHQQLHIPQVYRPTLRQRHAWRHGSARHYNGHEDQERNEKIARYLYHRFRVSDQYMKYRNRQHKDDKGSQKQKWPDRLELAFFQALVKWPPMGRRKLHHKDKQRGRNELIADHIEELTGEARTRKQVSSHIQVLKPFVEHDPFIMKWLSKEDFGISNTSSARAHAGASYNSGRRMSNYPVTALPDEMRGIVPSNPQAQRLDLSKAKHLPDIFEPIDFSMFVQRKMDADKIQRLHTYTQSIQDPLQENEPLADWSTLSHNYPLLASMHAHRPLDCNVLLAEASLAFPTELWKDQDGVNLPGVELGIAFLCGSRLLPENAQVYCQNSFYKHGQSLRGDHNGSSVVYLTPSEDGQGVETQVKFGSSFWARTLAHLASQLRSTPTDPTKDMRGEVATHIAALNAVQEIFVVTERGPERVLIIYWRFRLSTHTRGRACWQRLMLPSTTSRDYPDQNNAEQVQPQRVDSVYEYPVQHYASDSQQPASTATVPALQPPFEYESTSSGSALTSATWPSGTTSFESDGFSTAPQSAVDFTAGGGGSGDGNGANAFDFNGGNINISYDTSMVDFSQFDSSAFNFDAADAAAFAADPALQDYSAGGAGWSAEPFSAASTTSNTVGYDATPHQHTAYGGSVPAGSTTAAAPMHGGDAGGPSTGSAIVYGAGAAAAQPGAAAYEGGGFGGRGDGTGSGLYVQHQHHTPSSAGFHGDGGQAFGGAGQEGIKDHDAALAALADASYLVSGMVGQDHTGVS